MLLLQYSVMARQAKSELDYANVNEVLLVVLMVNSPKPFREYDRKSDRYIHRFTMMTADTGLTYPTKAKVMYVQLDKCLAQFRMGENAETEDKKPDRLQKWLAMIADVNDEKVRFAVEEDEELVRIKEEIHDMAQDREVQNMLIQEDFERMDWLTYGRESEARGEAIGEARGVAIGEARGEARGETRGDARRMEEDAKGMYAEGLKPDVIARIQKTTVDVIERILGLQNV